MKCEYRTKINWRYFLNFRRVMFMWTRKCWNDSISKTSFPPNLSPQWDGEALCSESSANPSTPHHPNKSFCLIKRVTGETSEREVYFGNSPLKRFRDSQCAVLEPFRNLDSSRRIPSKDRSRGIYWNRQKASLWQEAMGTTQTGTHAHRNCGNYPG